MFTPELTTKLERARLAAVLTIEDPADAVPVARALLAGGVTVIELACRTPCATEAIRRIREGVPEITIGAGTILSPQQIEEALAAGAAFGVAPGCNPRTIRAAQDCGLPFAPGVATATDIEMAVENQCRLLKFFPAETSGGLGHLSNIAAPFAHLGLRYIPLGGVNAGNLATYLQSPLVVCVGGSWLAKPDVIQKRDWETIRRNAAEAMASVHTTRRT
jgi:2-dehydro-3-deoxyphosphogluconate aldolase/(4S)-4-hydroxy-2-oxoglutarate aldolase